MRAACSLIALLLPVFSLLVAQPAPRPLTGTVLDSKTGLPIPNARVSVSVVVSPNAGQEPLEESVLTDAAGRFTFSRAFPTRPAISVTKHGYAPGTEQDSSEDLITIKLTPFATVEGRVVNSDGEPLPGIHIELMQGQVQDGRRRWHDHASANTNDLGQFRLWHLTPGDYVLKALGRYQTYYALGEMVRFRESEESFGPVYYPSAETLAIAEPLHLEPGAAVQADFKLAGHRAYQITGRLQGLSSYSGVMLQLLRGAEVLGSRATVNPFTGTFQMLDVPEGQYMLRALLAEPKPMLGETTVTVKAADVKGLEIVLGGGVIVRGTLHCPPVPAPPGALRASAFPLKVELVRMDDILIGNQSPGVSLGQDGEFVLEDVLPGKYEVEVRGLAYPKSARLGVTDVLADGLTVTAAGVSALEIELGVDVGTIKWEFEEAHPEDAIVYLVPRRGTMARFFMQPRFLRRVSNPGYQVPPGEYTALAIRPGAEFEYRNPAVLESLAGWAVPVTVRAGQTTEIKLRVKP